MQHHQHEPCRNFQNHVSAELRKSDDRMDEIVEKITAIEAEQAEAKKVLADTIQTINRVETNTQEMLEVFASWKGAMRVLEMFGKLARPLGYIATLVAAVIGAYAVIKNGGSLK